MSGQSYNPDDYETVAERLPRFWAAHPNGRISTDMVFHDEEAGVVIFVAALYREVGDDIPFSVGWAREDHGQGFVNKTSHLENCETSAIGRAISNSHLADAGAPRPSREEMQKTQAAGAGSGHAAPASTPPSTGATVPAAVIEEPDDISVLADLKRLAARGKKLGLNAERLRATAGDVLGRTIVKSSDIRTHEEIETVNRALDELEQKGDAE